MPNRILRDWTDSFTISVLDAFAERFFIRLIMKADDFGRFHADTRLLKASLFPLLPDVRESDISRWLAECEKAGLLRVYVDGKGRNYLEIANFKQRSRQSESKFPSPDNSSQPEVRQKPDKELSDDRQAAVKGQASGGQLRTYSETYSETKTEPPSVKICSMDSTEPLADPLEEIFPGHASDRRLIEELVKLAMKLKASPQQIRAFPDWLATHHPKKAFGPYAFKDLFALSVKVIHHPSSAVKPVEVEDWYKPLYQKEGA